MSPLELAPARQDLAPWSLASLRSQGTAPALITETGVVDYATLADRAEAVQEQLGPDRRLCLIRATTSVETVVALVAALAGGHPAILAPADGPATDRWDERYRPDAVLDPADGLRVELRGHGSAHDLHPDLALCLGTSGSTGAAKLVRLSGANLAANARSIGTYLGLGPRDRGVLHLPLHYCYGLSVLTSHLAVGAGLVVADRSVLDPAFWTTLDRHGATGLAGVPYTFELLDPAALARRAPATLRYVTQAGGKLPAPRVTELVETGRTHGWDFVVMYGQTEATARMAYLPAEEAVHFPGAIGRAVPGGTLRVEGADESGVGELVYEGPNVMMGYAETPGCLARGAELDRLRTGDLAREVAPGLFEVVGRRSRFAKLFGVRIDLDELGRDLAAAGTPALCVDLGDDGLGVVAACPAVEGAAVAREVARRAGVPAWCVTAATVDALPRTGAGKPDLPAARRILESAAPTAAVPDPLPDEAAWCALYAEILDVDEVRPEDSFVTLGGQSVTYVRLAARLGELVDDLPADWPTRTIAELSRRPAGRRRLLARLETAVLLRAVAIVAIVAGHVELLGVTGGAHVLLGVAGFNLARFLPREGSAGTAARTLLAAAGTVALSTVVWLVPLIWLGADVNWSTAALANGWLGSDTWDEQWRFWFVEALVWCTVAAAALFAVPGVARLDRRHGFALATTVWAACLGLRWALTGLEAGPTERYTGAFVAWCLALGWMAARAAGLPQRALTGLAVVVSVPGFFGDPEREAVVVAGLLLLAWVPAVRVPRAAVPAVAAVASASLSIYLTHWVVYPPLEDDHPWIALAASVAVGLGHHEACRRLRHSTRHVRGRLRATRRPGYAHSERRNTGVRATVGSGVRASDRRGTADD